MARRIAFYAPLKPPDHPIASGDREIARLLMTALSRAGHSVELASRFIAYQKRPSESDFEARKTAGTAEALRLIAELSQRPHDERPEAWLTYHPYCKAPDWLGPAVADALAIPYLTAEAARTRQNSDADWAAGRAAVADAIRRAAVNFVLKPSDHAYLETVLDTPETIRPLAPFIDVAALPPLPEPSERADGPARIVTVGMMRPGKKAECYRMLTEALAMITDRPWRLTVIGDGPERHTIEQAVSPFGDRVRFLGSVPHDTVIAEMDEADIFAWPGHREPIGMVYLEAQARRLPVAAFNSLGVPTVVDDGVSGLLAPEGDIAAYADILATLIDDPERRQTMGAAARPYVLSRHDIAPASETLTSGIEDAIAAKRSSVQ